MINLNVKIGFKYAMFGLLFTLLGLLFSVGSYFLALNVEPRNVLAFFAWFISVASSFAGLVYALLPVCNFGENKEKGNAVPAFVVGIICLVVFVNSAVLLLPNLFMIFPV